MRGRLSCLLQSAGGEANKSALSSMPIISLIFNMPKQGKPARLDYSSEFGLLY